MESKAIFGLSFLSSPLRQFPCCSEGGPVTVAGEGHR